MKRGREREGGKEKKKDPFSKKVLILKFRVERRSRGVEGALVVRSNGIQNETKVCLCAHR